MNNNYYKLNKYTHKILNSLNNKFKKHSIYWNRFNYHLNNITNFQLGGLNINKIMELFNILDDSIVKKYTELHENNKKCTEEYETNLLLRELCERKITNKIDKQLFIENIAEFINSYRIILLNSGHKEDLIKYLNFDPLDENEIKKKFPILVNKENYDYFSTKIKEYNRVLDEGYIK